MIMIMMRWKQSRALSLQLLPNEPASIRSGPGGPRPTISVSRRSFTVRLWSDDVVMRMLQQQTCSRSHPAVSEGFKHISIWTLHSSPGRGGGAGWWRWSRFSLLRSPWLHLQPHLISMKLERGEKFGWIYSIQQENIKIFCEMGKKGD